MEPASTETEDLTTSGPDLPPTGAEVFEAGDQDSEVVGSLRTSEAVTHAKAEGRAEEDLLRAQSPELVTGKEPGGPGLDLLESRLGGLVDVLRELMERLDSPGETHLTSHGTSETVGFIDHGAEEYICCLWEALATEDPEDPVAHSAGLVEAADYLGIDPPHLEGLLASPEGRAWLFSGEDPSEFDEDAVGGEIEALGGMWDIPEDEKAGDLDREVEDVSGIHQRAAGKA